MKALLRVSHEPPAALVRAHPVGDREEHRYVSGII